MSTPASSNAASTPSDANAPVSAPEARPAKAAFASRRALIAVSVAVLVGVAGIGYIAAPKSAVATDNAYLQADSAVIAPKVRGLVADVLVQHNQRVHRGDALVRIDAEEFDARVESAQAAVLDAQARQQSARAALVSLDAEEHLAASNTRAAQATIDAADAQRERAIADRRRYDNLVGSGAVAQYDADRFRATALSAIADAQKTRAQLDVSRQQESVTHAKRLTIEASLAQADAALASAQAALDLARQDQKNSIVRASIDGVVGDRQVEPGDYVQPGTRLLTVVPVDALYVIANFKETQTDRMLPGQPASIEVDALPGQKLQGVVESFAPGSGSQFSLLPFEPGTGNFTKIVQRIPVRIRFVADQPALAALRPGLSSLVTVELKPVAGQPRYSAGATEPRAPVASR